MLPPPTRGRRGAGLTAAGAAAGHQRVREHHGPREVHQAVYQAYWVFQAYRVLQVLDSYATVYSIYATVYKGTPGANLTLIDTPSC